jgi:hypothetical protein
MKEALTSTKKSGGAARGHRVAPRWRKCFGGSFPISAFGQREPFRYAGGYRMTRQGDVALLNDAVAERLLQSPIPAQFAYSWMDGSPRVVPIWFHWDGQQIVLGTPARAPKMKALACNPRVSLTINTYDASPKVLYVRGTVSVQMMQEIVPEYVLMAQRMLGQGADAWINQVQAMLPAMGGMARLSITPEWVGILDFERRFPSAIELAASGIASGAV